MTQKSFSVDFRGSVQSAEVALKQLLENEEISPQIVETDGKVVNFPEKEIPSYVADIAPVLAERCASCHREGGVAPLQWIVTPWSKVGLR